MSALVFVTLGVEAPADLPGLRSHAQRLGGSLAALQGTALPPLVDALAAVTGDPAGPGEGDGVVHVRLVPVDADARRAGGASWVRRVAAHHLRSLPAERRRRIHVETTAAVVTDLAALTDAGLRDREWRVVTGEEAPLRSPAWEEAPPHTHHVLVCRGPRCNAQGSADVAATLAAEFHERGVLDDGVLLTATGCLFPCNRAPVVVVHPGPDAPPCPAVVPGIGWHGPVHPGDVPGLVGHLLDPWP